MKTILASALALGVMAAPVFAAPVDDQAPYGMTRTPGQTMQWQAPAFVAAGFAYGEVQRPVVKQQGRTAMYQRVAPNANDEYDNQQAD